MQYNYPMIADKCRTTMCNAQYVSIALANPLPNTLDLLAEIVDELYGTHSGAVSKREMAREVRAVMSVMLSPSSVDILVNQFALQCETDFDHGMLQELCGQTRALCVRTRASLCAVTRKAPHGLALGNVTRRVRIKLRERNPDICVELEKAGEFDEQLTAWVQQWVRASTPRAHKDVASGDYPLEKDGLIAIAMHFELIKNTNFSKLWPALDKHVAELVEAGKFFPAPPVPVLTENEAIMAVPILTENEAIMAVAQSIIRYTEAYPSARLENLLRKHKFDALGSQERKVLNNMCKPYKPLSAVSENKCHQLLHKELETLDEDGNRIELLTRTNHTVNKASVDEYTRQLEEIQVKVYQNDFKSLYKHMLDQPCSPEPERKVVSSKPRYIDLLAHFHHPDGTKMSLEPMELPEHKFVIMKNRKATSETLTTSLHPTKEIPTMNYSTKAVAKFTRIFGIEIGPDTSTEMLTVYVRRIKQEIKSFDDLAGTGSYIENKVADLETGLAAVLKELNSKARQGKNSCAWMTTK